MHSENTFSLMSRSHFHKKVICVRMKHEKNRSLYSYRSLEWSSTTNCSIADSDRNHLKDWIGNWLLIRTDLNEGSVPNHSSIIQSENENVSQKAQFNVLDMPLCAFWENNIFHIVASVLIQLFATTDVNLNNVKNSFCVWK
jgi:hypothetical protein